MPPILGFVMKEALNTEGGHPAFDKRRCLNARQGKISCSACTQNCPGHVILDPQKGKMDWERCLNCGICTSVCPAHAFDLADHRRSQMLRMLHDGREEHAIGCSRVEGELDCKTWCLASFSWEMLAALALVGQVKVLQGDCAQCDRREKLPCFERALERTRAFLGEERFENRVIRTSGAAQRGVSRRALFGKLLPGTAKVQVPEKERSSGQRKLLRQTLKRTAGAQDGFGWNVPQVSQACWACGICAKVCPVEAIAVEQRDGAWQVVCKPMRCTGCGVCEAVCPEQAIEECKPIRFSTTQKEWVWRANAATCSACGAAVKPDSGEELCMRCKAIQKSKRK